MSEGSLAIEGRVTHAVSNALSMSFSNGPGEPLATAVQGAADGRKRKLGVLLGFKNGGVGRHVLSFADGTSLIIESNDAAPSIFTRSDGTSVCTVTRGETSTALGCDGRSLLHFLPDPDDAKTVEAFRLLVTDPVDQTLAHLDVIRTVAGWSLSMALDDAADLSIWWDRAGQPLKVPLLGTRILLERAMTAVEREVLIGACVDMAIGLRPYVGTMR